MAQAEDRIYPSDNELEIPNLLLEWQPRNGLLLPFAGWGVTPRAKRGIATYHFYVDDYRFNNIWQRPERLVQSGCQEAVEPNFSLFQTTPIAYGLQLLYKKRWIARWLQECGVRVWVDLNVAPKFRELNKLGVLKATTHLRLAATRASCVIWKQNGKSQKRFPEWKRRI